MTMFYYCQYYFKYWWLLRKRGEVTAKYSYEIREFFVDAP